jgi:hypothetical protein
MDRTADSERLADSLAGWLDPVTFVDQGVDEVTALLVEAVAAWATGQGWRVYRRAASVMKLPPPYDRQHSWLDIACARPEGPPVAVEIDHSDRRRTVDKLLAEAGAGRVALWLRWGTGGFEPPPLPVRMVTCRVTARRGQLGQGKLYSRLPDSARPAPAHSSDAIEPGEQSGLFG